MKAEALYVVVTPRGHVGNKPAFTEEEATAIYMREWLPDGVKLTPFLTDALWRQFMEAGYRVERLTLPEKLDGSPVCIT